MKTYIIKNCPQFTRELVDGSTELCGHWEKCKNIPDCLLKLIYEKCKRVQFECDKELINGNYPDKYKYFKSGRADLGQEICDLLDIEEVEG